MIALPRRRREAMANEVIGKLTDTCWDKYILGIGGSFSNNEASCLNI